MPEQIPHSPIPETQEHAPRSLVDATVDAAATSQARLVALMALARDPSRPLTSSGLMNEINTLQGDEPGWGLPKSANGMVYRYSDAFAETGLARVTTDVSGRRWIQADEAAAPTVLAVAGTLFGWQLRHPGLALQDVFGGNYRAAPESQHGHSSLRLAIISQALLGGTSHRGIAKALGEPSLRVDAAIRELAAGGILQVRNKADREARMLTIDPDVLKMSKAALRSAPGSTTRALWDATRQLASQGVTRISGQQFLETLDPQVDRDEAWSQLVKSLAQDRLRYLQFEPTSDDPHARTQVVVNPAYARALAELTGRLDILRTGSTHLIEDAKERALLLLDNEWAVSQLMARAREVSGGTRRAPESTGGVTPADSSVSRLQAAIAAAVSAMPESELVASHSIYLRALAMLEATLEGSTNPQALRTLEALRVAQERIHRSIGNVTVATLHLQQYSTHLTR